MTGSIPIDVGYCTRLNEMMLGGNEFNGTLPAELGLISLSK